MEASLGMWGARQSFPRFHIAIAATRNTRPHHFHYSRLRTRGDMIASKARTSCLTRWIQRNANHTAPQRTRSFSRSSQLRTDGVFRELTSQRTQMPWIEALRKQQREGNSSSEVQNTPQAPVERDLTPKKMKDSYYRVVGLQLRTFSEDICARLMYQR